MSNVVNKVKKNNGIYDIQDTRIADISNFVTVSGVQNLNNKTLVSPKITGTIISDSNGIKLSSTLKKEQGTDFYAPISVSYSTDGTEANADGRSKWKIESSSTNSGLISSTLKFGLINDGAAPVVDIYSFGGASAPWRGLRLNVNGAGLPSTLEYHRGVGGTDTVEQTITLPYATGTIALIADVPTNLINGEGNYSAKTKAPTGGGQTTGTTLGTSSFAIGTGNIVAFTFTVNGTSLTCASADNSWLNRYIKYNDEYKRITKVENSVVTIESALSVTSGSILASVVAHVTKGNASFIQGSLCQAVGDYSHAEGQSTSAIGTASHSSGYHTIARGDYETVIGKYNNTNRYGLFTVGCGSDDSHRNNALEVNSSGDTWIKSLTVDSGGLSVGGQSYFEDNVDVDGDATLTGSVNANAMYVDYVEETQEAVPNLAFLNDTWAPSTGFITKSGQGYTFKFKASTYVSGQFSFQFVIDIYKANGSVSRLTYNDADHGGQELTYYNVIGIKLVSRNIYGSGYVQYGSGNGHVCTVGAATGAFHSAVTGDIVNASGGTCYFLMGDVRYYLEFEDD